MTVKVVKRVITNVYRPRVRGVGMNISVIDKDNSRKGVRLSIICGHVNVLLI